MTELWRAGRPAPPRPAAARVRGAKRARSAKSGPWSRALRRRAGRLEELFFPPEVPLPEPARRVVAAALPNLDLGAVSFHAGMPHLLRLAANQGITLPATFGVRRVRVYIDPRWWRPDTVRGLGLVLHECFHAQQIQESPGGRGLGLLHPFIALYLACAAANRFRYAGHPLESDAFCLAGRSGSRFECEAARVPAPEGFVASAPEGERVAAVVKAFGVAGTGLRFWARVAASTPGAGLLGRLFSLPLAAAWLVLWTAASAAAGLAAALVEVTGAAAVGVLRAGASAASSIETILVALHSVRTRFRRQRR